MRTSLIILVVALSSACSSVPQDAPNHGTIGTTSVTQNGTTGTTGSTTSANNLQTLNSDNSTSGTPRMGPALEVLPRALDFGVVEPGATKSLAVTLRASGTEPTEVVALSLAGAEFRIEDAPALPFAVAPGEELVLDVIFTPTELRDRGGVLNVTSTNPDVATFEVTLEGNGSCGRIEPVTMMFENAVVGQQYRQNFVFTNCSDRVEIAVDSVEATRGGSERYLYDFAIEPPTEFPVLVLAGDSLLIPVVFAPESPGEHALELAVQTTSLHGTRSGDPGVFSARAAGRDVQ